MGFAKTTMLLIREASHHDDCGRSKEGSGTEEGRGSDEERAGEQEEGVGATGATEEEGGATEEAYHRSRWSVVILVKSCQNI